MKIPIRAIYTTTWEKDKALRKYLQYKIPTGKVLCSCSAATAPILFVQKKDGSFRLCVDCKALNHLTIPNKYPLPLISEFLDTTRDGKWFTRLNLKNRYNLISIAARDEWKTAFCTKLGLFQYIGMLFGLTNAPALFQEMIHTIFKGIEGYIWHVNTILIYGGNTEAEH